MKLYNEDCLEVLKEIPDASVDLVVTDCPYHIVSGGCSNEAVTIGRYTQTGEILNKRVRTDEHGNKFYSDSKHVSLCGILNDANPQTYTRQGKLFKFNEIKFSEWLPEVYRILKPGTHIYIMINPRNLKDLGLPTIESVGRCRRKLQEEKPELWSDKQVQKYREENEKVFEDYARS